MTQFRRPIKQCTHDDEADARNRALELLNPQMRGWGPYEHFRQISQVAGAVHPSLNLPKLSRPRLDGMTHAKN
jgi:hypothetical protein